MKPSYAELRRLRHDLLREEFPPRKEEAECCRAKALPDGRPVLGFCSPECIRRPANWKLVLLGEPIPKGGALGWRPPGPTDEHTKETQQT